jgi:hypothetical protein
VEHGQSRQVQNAPTVQVAARLAGSDKKAEGVLGHALCNSGTCTGRDYWGRHYCRADGLDPPGHPSPEPDRHSWGRKRSNIHALPHDGDTVWIDGVKIRVADIDAPETHPPRCAHEAELGNRATQRLFELINQGPVIAEPTGTQDEDRYGRKLRILMRDGQSLGGVLV